MKTSKLSRQKDFEILNHTADIGIIAYGGDIRQVFENAARGMFSLITDLHKVKEVESRDIEAEAQDRESLLVAWLNELIYLFDVENLLFNRFEITFLNDTRIRAGGYGEKADPSRHQLKLGIKAATYHMLKIEEKDGGFRAQVIFDI